MEGLNVPLISPLASPPPIRQKPAGEKVRRRAPRQRDQMVREVERARAFGKRDVIGHLGHVADAFSGLQAIGGSGRTTELFVALSKEVLIRSSGSKDFCRKKV